MSNGDAKKQEFTITLPDGALDLAGSSLYDEVKHLSPDEQVQCMTSEIRRFIHAECCEAKAR